MISLPQAYGAADGKAIISVNAGGKASSSTAASQSLTNMNWGSPLTNATRRTYVLCLFNASGASAVTLNSASIGGVAATMFSGFSSPTSATAGYRVFAAPTPTGATGTIDFVFSGAILTGMLAYTFGIFNQRTAIASAEVDVDSLASASAATLSRTMTCVAGGFLLSGLGLAAATSTVGNNMTVLSGANAKQVAWDTVTSPGNTAYDWSWSGAQACKMFASAFNI